MNKAKTTLRRRSAERWSEKMLADATVAKLLRGLPVKSHNALAGLFAKHIDDLLADRARYYEGKLRKQPDE